MNLRKILIPVVASLMMLAMTAEARYVFVLPAANATSPTLRGFTEDLVAMGSVAVPTGVNQVLLTPDGTKLAILAENTASALSFATIQNNVFSGAARNLNLDGMQAVKAQWTPDGQKLVIIGKTATSGVLYIVDPVSETVLFYGKVPLNGVPQDLVVTQDSKYAATVTATGQLIFVDLSTGTVLESKTTPVGSTGTISLAPNGTLYLAGIYNFITYDPKPPFNQLARSQGWLVPGKMTFSLDGRYAVVPNLSGVSNSVITFDTQITATEGPAGAQVGEVAIKPHGTLAQVTQLTMFDGSTALAYLGGEKMLYQVTYPLMSASEAFFQDAGYISNMLGFATTNEVTAVKSIFYLNDATGLVRYDVAAKRTFTSVNSVTGGGLVFQSTASRAAVAAMKGYGGGQTVGGLTALRPYYVRALDANGRPVAGATVVFSAQTGASVLTEISSTTNQDGYAWATATSPNVNGSFVVRAAVGAVSVDFTSYVTGVVTDPTNPGGGGGDNPTPGVPRPVKVSGDGQAVSMFVTYNNPMVMQLLDADDQPMVNKMVTWTAADCIVLTAQPVVQTDDKGMSTMTWAASATFSLGEPYRTCNITANTDYGNAVFRVTIFPFSGTWNKGWGTYLIKPTLDTLEYTGKLGETLKGAIVTNSVTMGINGASSGLPIPNLGLVVTSANQDPAAGPVARCVGTTAMSDATGTATCDLVISGKVGRTRLSVNVGGESSGDLPIYLTATPGDPGKPVIVSGNNQVAKVSTAFAQKLIARVTDGNSIPLPGTAVTWSVVTPGSVVLSNTVSTADANGTVSTTVTAGTTAGAYQVKVSVGTLTTTFDLTVQPVATNIVKVSGDSQTGTVVGTAFALPLLVKVTDAAGNGVTGAQVNWTVPSGSALLTDAKTTTLAGGFTQVYVTAGPVAGTITVNAAVTGVGSVTFTLQSRLAGPSIVASSFANMATGEAVIAPGNLILITGSGLATGVNGSISASLLSGNLPTTLNGVSVSFKSGSTTLAAPIYRVSNLSGLEAVLVQAPFEITGSTVDATVTVNGGTTTVTGLPVVAVSPGVLESIVDNRLAAVAIREDGKAVTKATPARRGEKIRMYTIGLGQTTPTAVTNQVGIPGQSVKAPIAVGIDNKGVTVISAMMAENLVGVYEIVFQVPADATIGADRPLGFVMEATPGKQSYANGSVIPIGQ